MIRTTGSLMSLRRTLLLVAALGCGGSAWAIELGRHYPGTGHHASGGKYCWPYHPSEAAVPQKHGYGYYPTMWRDWHENAYLIFSEPEHTCVVLPEKPRRERREELPTPEEEDEQTAPEDDVPPPPEEFRPPSEMPEGPPGGAATPPPTEPAATPPDATAPPAATPPEIAPPAEEPSLPDLPDTFPGAPTDIPTLPDGPPAGPMSRKPRPVIRSSDYEGPALNQPSPERPSARTPKELSRAATPQEALTLKALRQGFANDSRVLPASATLPIEESPAPSNSKPKSQRMRIDRSVAPASSVMPAAAPNKVSHAAYHTNDATIVSRAIGHEVPVASPSAAKAKPAKLPTPSDRDNPLRYETSGAATNAATNPLRR